MNNIIGQTIKEKVMIKEEIIKLRSKIAGTHNNGSGLYQRFSEELAEYRNSLKDCNEKLIHNYSVETHLLRERREQLEIILERQSRPEKDETESLIKDIDMQIDHIDNIIKGIMEEQEPATIL